MELPRLAGWWGNDPATRFAMEGRFVPVARADAWPDRAFPGTVLAIDTRFDARSRSATVRATIPNLDRMLHPGMLVKVEVDRGEAPVLQVPEESIVPSGAEHFVFAVDDASVARRTRVQIGRRRVGFVEILAGLDEGARVVVEGVVRVRPDADVVVVAERSTDP